MTGDPGPASAEPGATSRTMTWAVASFICLGAFLRVYRFWSSGLWTDEYGTWWVVAVARRVCGGDRRGLLRPLRLRLRGGRPGRAPARGAWPLVALVARVAVDAARAGARLPFGGAAARAPLRAAWGPGLGAAGDVVRPSPSLRRLSRPPAPHRARRGRCPDRGRPRAAPAALRSGLRQLARRVVRAAHRRPRRGDPAPGRDPAVRSIRPLHPARRLARRRRTGRCREARGLAPPGSLRRPVDLQPR